VIKQGEMCGVQPHNRGNGKCCKNLSGMPSVKTIWKQHLVFQEQIVEK